MTGVAIIIAVGAFIAWREVPSLFQNKQKKELWAFSVLLLFGLAAGITVQINRNVPSPLEWITLIFKPISDLLAAIGLIV
ncbi:hypothetical protein [Paenibacillus faecalis]|uniref:hypothetical protein n=1 Tax=Paenibacillus faecalis TaxID=2079532 RepID=UPI000D0EF70A|nr:hypothetical protein [Paenibacillus faecalis]